MEVIQTTKKEYKKYMSLLDMGLPVNFMIWQAPNNKWYRVNKTGGEGLRAMHEFNQDVKYHIGKQEKLL